MEEGWVRLKAKLSKRWWPIDGAEWIAVPWLS